MFGDRARKSKCKNIFAQGHTPNWSEKVVIKKLKLLFDGHMLLEVLPVKELLERFMKNWKRQMKQNLGYKK